MAQESATETLDTSPTQSSSPPPPSSDRTLSRNVSLSRLNAKAPEFVPIRGGGGPTRPDLQQQSTQQQQPQQQQRIVNVIPPAQVPSPPPGVVLYPGPHYIPIQSHVGMPVHVPVHNHHHHGQYHHHHHHSSNHQSSYNHGNQYYGGGYGEQEAVGVQAHQASKSGEETNMKILNQVEYYFSDLNLATTDHLMRFINKDPEGYVPLNVVASFKKIKSLISSHSQLASILRNSTKLVVSEDSKKVKRQHPLTESDMEELQSRIVVAENLPEDHCHQNLMKVFSAIGSVKTIRTCQPQPTSGGSSSASRPVKADGMLFYNKLHAFVEYESVELADKAVAELNDVGNWRSGLRVRLFLRRSSKPAHSRGKKGPDGEGNCEEDDTSTSELQSVDKQVEDSSQQSHAQSLEHTGEELINEKEGGQKKGRSRGRGKGRGRGQPHHNNRGNHMAAPLANSPANNEQPSSHKQPPGPRMPDGTRGFSMGRGKPVAVTIAQ